MTKTLQREILSYGLAPARSGHQYGWTSNSYDACESEFSFTEILMLHRLKAVGVSDYEESILILVRDLGWACVSGRLTGPVYTIEDLAVIVAAIRSAIRSVD